jgi:lipoic acid synthetase
MKQPLPKPAWLKRRLAPAGKSSAVLAALNRPGLHTVCQEALCPNRSECFGRGEATFLLLGPSCTRRCTFCAVQKHSPARPDPHEPEQVAQAAQELGLSYVVLTMVSRDDLPDGGADHMAHTIEALHQAIPEVGVEALISDLAGSQPALDRVLAAEPQVLNHNLETIPRLYAALRPQARYQRSLEVLRYASSAGALTKSGLMLGLGESREELLEVMAGLLDAGCVMLTLGQYLAPSPAHHPVKHFIKPEDFSELSQTALNMGFRAVASGPYVRSSYQAAALRQQAINS